MNRKKVLIVVIFIVLVILVNKINNSMQNKVMKSYNFVIGVSTFHNVFQTDKDLYGYKDGKLVKIKGRYKANRSNFNYIVGTQDLITYFDYDTYMKLYNEMNRGTSGVEYKGMSMRGVLKGYEKNFEKYYNNYIYDPKDKMEFDNMINYIISTHENNNQYYSAKYFFIANNNYYVYMYENQKYVMYSYKDNTLNKLFEFTGDADIEYFK